MPLTDRAIKQATPKQKPQRLADAHGLYVIVQPNGSKWWRFDFRFAKKRQTISFGTYPDVPLTEARDKCRQAREQLRDGINPSLARRANQQRAKLSTVNTVEAVAREWLAKRTLAPRTVIRVTHVFEAFVFPAIGARLIAEIEPADVLAMLQPIEAKGYQETAHRAKQICGQVFRYAVATGRAGRDPVADLRGALAPVSTTHFATITEPADIGRLMRAIHGYDGSAVVCAALKLAPLVFVRPGELRAAKWTEIDLHEALWRLPAERMKGRIAHLVPLSRQAVAILRDLEPLTGTDKYVFPSERRNGRPMSENTLNAALRALGYSSEQMTSHGFRSMASTRLNEMGYRSDLIERQLAHVDKDQVRAAYNRAEYLSERVAMLQDWADELDRLRQNVVTFERTG